jgi:hypothetical protein
MLNKGQYLRKLWVHEVSSCLDEAERSDWEDVVQLPNNGTTVAQYTAPWWNVFSLNHVTELEDTVAPFVAFVGIRPPPPVPEVQERCTCMCIIVDLSERIL